MHCNERKRFPKRVFKESARKGYFLHCHSFFEQVARPVGGQARVLSPASIQPVLGYDSQQCTIYSHGQPVPTQKVVLVKSAPLSTSVRQVVSNFM